MQQAIIIANWKSNMTESEAMSWLSVMQEIIVSTQKQVILCAPFTLLEPLHKEIRTKNIPLLLGAQDISPFDKGAYTGAINGEQLQEFVTFVLIGHSERREKFGETDEQLQSKVAMAQKYHLTPIYCVQGSNTFVPQGVSIVAYEPVEAIGSGKPDDPKDVVAVTQAIKTQEHIQTMLYGGSVNSENVEIFTQIDGIGGVLVGSASLHPQEFSQIIKNA